MSWWDDQPFDPDRDAGEDPYYVHADRVLHPTYRGSYVKGPKQTTPFAPAPRREVNFSALSSERLTALDEELVETRARKARLHDQMAEIAEALA